MCTEPTFHAASTIVEDIHTAYRLIAEHYQRLRYPPEKAHEYIYALAASLECQVSESVQVLIIAVAFHVQRGCLSKFVKQQMIGRAEAGLTLRQVVVFSYPRRRNYDPPVSNTGVADPTAQEDA